MKKKKFRPLKCINGTKGAIALFLAVLMTPFLSVAMILVEVGRYNSAVSILDEALGVSSVSTLANYDSYLQKRWGLLTVKQDSDIDAVFNENMKINSGVLGNTLKLNTLNAKGLYPLSDSEILYNQIMEYSKLNAPTKLTTNFLNISDLLKDLEKIKSIGNFLRLITSGTDAIDSTITLVESADKLKKISGKIEKYKQDYSSTYAKFQSSVNDLIDALNQPRPDSSEDQEGAEAYDDNIELLIDDAEMAKNNYEEAIGVVLEELKNFKKEMSECGDAIASIQTDIGNAVTSVAAIQKDRSEKAKDLNALNDEIKKMEEEGMNESNTAYSHALDYRAALEPEVAKLNVQTGIGKATQQSLYSVSDKWKASFSNYSEETLGRVISSFESLKTKVKNYKISGVTSNSNKISDDKYRLEVGGYIDSASIKAFLDEQKKELTSGSLSALLDGIVAFFNSIFKTKLFYDPALSAYIDVDYYQKTFGGLPGQNSAKGGVMEIMANIGQLLTDIKDFSANILGLELIDALKELKNIIVDIGHFFESLIRFAIDILKNIADLFESYERLYCTTYATFNLPCRTDRRGGNLFFITMSGHKLTAESLPTTNVPTSGVPVFDDLVALIDTIKKAANGTGDDITFSGAELEYILYGSNSEVANQMYTFCALYLFKLLVDIPAVLTNAEVQSMAAASTFGYPVVMALEILAEPLAETILLVNGEKVALSPFNLYLTPSGLPSLLESIISVCKFTQEQKKDMSGKLLSAFHQTEDDYNYQKTLNDFNRDSKKSDGVVNKVVNTATGSKYLKGLFNLDYREYCFLIMLLTVTTEQQLGRLSNLIQMESLHYYKTQGASYDFDLRNAYTFLSAEANVSVKQMLPSLADSSLFTITRKHYRGY